MALDLSIYGNLLRPPKTVAEYAAEMDAADQNKLALQGARMNLLSAQQNQQDEQALRALYQQKDFNPQSPEGLASIYRISPKAGAAAQAAALGAQKTQAEIGKERALTEKAQTETTGLNWDQQLKRRQNHVAQLAGVSDVQSAVQWLKEATDSGELPAERAQQVASALQSGQLNLQEWRQRAMLGGLSALDQLKEQRAQEELRLRQANELIGPDGKVNQPLLGAKQSIASAGKTTVSVNTGQKGFENEMKLREDFKQEPVYKAHQEVQSAYQQIKSALGQKSPAGDLAGATKIMKLLDPGSVVRESELGMAMAASGLMDRLTNYAQMTMSGTKLTPNQRADFQALADKLYSASVDQFNAKRGEYDNLGKQWGLNAPRALGPEAKGAPAPADVQSLVDKYRSK